MTQTNPAMVQTGTDFRLVPVTTPAEWEQFLDVPAVVYKDDPNWVPPIRKTIAKELAPDNPFRQFGSLQAFLALRTESSGRSQPIGRIVASVNRRLIERENQNVGLFGYFECVSDFAVAQALLEAACDWLQQQGMTLARGPVDLFTSNRCLFLVEGFETSPVIMMPYNPPTYPQFVERNGWHRAKDAYAYLLPLDHQLADKFEKSYRVASKSGVTFRSVRTKGEGFTDDCRSMHYLFSTLFANNWSATPHTEEQFLEEAKDLKTLVDPDVFIVAEYEGKMVGFFMTLPDYNIALKHVNGKLDLWGILKFLWYRRQINQLRVPVICSLPEFRRKMVSPALIYLGMQGAIKSGKPYRQAELGFVYEDNYPSRNIIEASGGKIYKTYRAYEKALG
jgi:hypothetical protein